MAKKINYWLTADIKINTDSCGSMVAVHKWAGVLIDNTIYESRSECRRDAVEVLKEMKVDDENEINESLLKKETS